MTDKEYKQKKRECWEKVKFALHSPNTDRQVFNFIFDRAFALGKQEAKQEPGSFQNGNTHYSGNHFADVSNMQKINGIIVNGRVYAIRDRKGWNCSPCSCDLYSYCIKQENMFNDNAPCLLSNAVIGLRYSPELTEKLKN